MVNLESIHIHIQIIIGVEIVPTEWPQLSILWDFEEIFYCNIDHNFKNFVFLSKLVNYWLMVDIIDPVAALHSAQICHLCEHFFYMVAPLRHNSRCGWAETMRQSKLMKDTGSSCWKATVLFCPSTLQSPSSDRAYLSILTSFVIHDFNLFTCEYTFCNPTNISCWLLMLLEQILKKHHVI